MKTSDGNYLYVERKHDLIILLLENSRNFQLAYRICIF